MQKIAVKLHQEQKKNKNAEKDYHLLIRFKSIRFPKVKNSRKFDNFS